MFQGNVALEGRTPAGEMLLAESVPYYGYVYPSQGLATYRFIMQIVHSILIINEALFLIDSFHLVHFDRVSYDQGNSALKIEINKVRT